jgi:hypothetical protein
MPVDKFLEGVLPGLKGPVGIADKGQRTQVSLSGV